MLKRSAFLATTLVLAVALSAVAFSSPARQSNQPIFGIPYPPWLTSSSSEISVSQLSAAYSAHNLTLRLPSQLPNGFSLTSVHVPDVNSLYGYAMVTYSSTGIKDFRYAEIVFEIRPGAQPSPNDLSTIINNTRGSFQLLTINRIPVLLNPQQGMGDPALQEQFGSSLYAQFWDGGIWYQVRAYHPLTADDILRLISSLQPVGNPT